MSAPAAVLRRAARRSLAAALIVVPTVVGVSAVDRGGDAWPVSTVLLLVGPACLAIGAAWGVAELRAEGAWDAALSLGWSPGRLLAGIALLGLLCGAGSLALPGPAASTGIGEVPPIPAGVAEWWDGTGWSAVDPRWQVPPAALSLPGLVRRAQEPRPAGTAGVDAAELLRRVGWGLGFVWAGGIGGAIGARRRGSRRSEAPAVAGAAALAAVAVWLIAVLAASAYVSAASIT